MAEILRVPIGGGASLSVERYGAANAHTVVFAHSLLCDGRMFADQVTDLARDFHVLNIDARAHGKSDTPRRGWTLADQADDIGRVLDAVNVNEAIIVGLSMGGMAAIPFAARHPSRVRGLVLLDTSAASETTRHRAKYLALATATRLFGVRQVLADQAMQIMFGDTFRRGSPEVVALWAERLMARNPTSIARAVQVVANRRDVRRRLSRVRAPALVIVGDEDTATPVSRARQLMAGLQDARLEVLPATGHLSTIERPMVTSKLIRHFCESLTRLPSPS